MTIVALNATVTEASNDIIADVKDLLGTENIIVNVFGNLNLKYKVVKDLVGVTRDKSENNKTCVVLFNLRNLTLAAKANLKNADGIIVIKTIDKAGHTGSLVSRLNKLTGFNVVKYKMFNEGLMAVFMAGKDREDGNGNS